MDQKKVLEQMLNFNKSAFKNTFNVMTMLQDQTERAAELCLKQADWLPQEGKKAVDGWLTACRQGRETFKNTVEDGFKKAEAMLADSPEKSSGDGGTT